jgi:Divergent InlB B-repeat domain
MNSILYGNFRLEVSGGAGSRVDRLAQRPPPGLLPRPRRAPESVPARPAGRDEQLDVVLRAVRAQRPVGFFGTCGYGKTTLLRYVAASAVTEGFAQQGVYLQAGPGALRDLLHRLVGELYTADRPVKLTPDECVEVLSQMQALVVADDVAFSRGQADYLQSVLPRCSLLVSSRRPVLSHDDSHQLAGLSDEAAVQMVIDDLGRPLSASEMADVRRLTGAVDGQPLHLRQATALVREGRQSFAALAKIAEHDPEALDRISVDALAEPSRRALAILTLAAGALLPIDLVAVMGGIAEIGECLSLLHRRGLAEQQHDGFGLPMCKAERYRQMLLKDVRHAAALRELTSWLATRNPAAPDSICAASAALAIAEWAAEGSDWPAVIELVRVAEPILTLAGHWEASRQALSHGLHAAVAAADHLSEALFSHQQGTVALCLDELTSAQQLLTHALRLREQHGDLDGTAVTRHNLQILQPPAPKPVRPRPRNLRKLLAVAGSGAVALLALTAGVAKALPPSPTPSLTSTTRAAPTPSPAHRDSDSRKHRGTGTSTGSSTNGSSGTGGGIPPPPSPPPPPPPPALKPPVLQQANFGLVDITPGQQDVSLPVTARNPNKRPLRITSAQTATPYTITADTCLDQRIPPQGSCTIAVQFAPTALGANGQILTVDSVAGTSTTQLSGTGDAVLTVTITGNGSVSDGNAINCTSGSCSEQITKQLTLTAKADAGNYFGGWGGSCQGSGADSTCQLTITADANVSAGFGGS